MPDVMSLSRVRPPPATRERGSAALTDPIGR